MGRSVIPLQSYERRPGLLSGKSVSRYSQLASCPKHAKSTKDSDRGPPSYSSEVWYHYEVDGQAFEATRTDSTAMVRATNTMLIWKSPGLGRAMFQWPTIIVVQVPLV